MEADPQQKKDTTESIIEPPETLFAEGRATYAHREDAMRPPDAAARSDGRSPVPREPSSEAFSSHVHSYVSEYIRFSDQKAAFVFALSGGLLCYLFKNGFHKMWLRPPSSWVALDFLCLTAMATLTIALAFSCLVITPILRKTHRGLVFFRSISEFESATAYASEILSTPVANLTRAVLQHTYDLSRVCSSKYWKLTMAVWLASIGVTLTALVLMIKP